MEDNNVKSKLLPIYIIKKDSTNTKVLERKRINFQINFGDVYRISYKYFMPQGYKLIKGNKPQYICKYNGNGLNLKSLTFEYIKSNSNHHKVSVQPVRNKITLQGLIIVDYMDSKGHLINHNQFTNQIGNPFNIHQGLSAIPKGYQLDKVLIGKDVNTFKSKPQMIIIQIKKIHDVMIIIKYFDKNKLVGRAKAEGIIGSPFNIHPYIENLPKGYRFDRIDGEISNVFKHNSTINIEVKKVNQYASTSKKNKSLVHNKIGKDPKSIGIILMKLASELHNLGAEIIKNQRL